MRQQYSTTKEEIFLELLRREYEEWIADLDAIGARAGMSDEGLADAMRLLDAAHIECGFRHFATDIALSGVEVARVLGIDQDQVFKTIMFSGGHIGYQLEMAPADLESVVPSPTPI